MASNWVWEYEIGYAAGGAVSGSGSLPMLPLRWREAVLTRRHHGIDEVRITIPRAEGHTVGEFDAWRELKLRRNGAYWWGGLLGALQAPGGERGDTLLLEGYGSAAALVQFHQDHPGSTGSLIPDQLVMTVTSDSNASRADNAINTLLNIAIRVPPYPGTPWFPSANRTISVGTFTPERLTFSGMNKLAILRQIVDSESWAWRTGIDSSGVWTFRAGSGVVTDRSGTIKLYSPGNCEITSYTPDATRLATHVRVVTRVHDVRQTLRLNAAVNDTILYFAGNSRRFLPGTFALVNPGGSTEEQVEISSSSGTTSATITSGLLYAHNAGEAVIADPDNPVITKLASTVKTSGERHHRLTRAVWADQVENPTTRQNLATAILNASDDLVQQAPVRITDPALIDFLLDQGLDAGDSVSLTSAWLPFSNTTLTVQTLTLTLRANGPAQLDLELGDPAEDALEALERKLDGLRAAGRLTWGVG